MDWLASLTWAVQPSPGHSKLVGLYRLQTRPHSEGRTMVTEWQKCRAMQAVENPWPRPGTSTGLFFKKSTNCSLEKMLIWRSSAGYEKLQIPQIHAIQVAGICKFPEESHACFTKKKTPKSKSSLLTWLKKPIHTAIFGSLCVSLATNHTLG